MRLKDLLPKSVYEAQKELFKEILDGGKRELKKKADDVYIIQKEIVKDIQDAAVQAAKKEAIKFYHKNFDKLCGIVKEKVPFIGSILAAILKKYEDEILEVII